MNNNKQCQYENCNGGQAFSNKTGDLFCCPFHAGWSGYTSADQIMTYPTYKTIVDELIRINDIKTFSEYGEWNHNICEEIYNNIDDKNKVNQLAYKIVKRGDFTTLQGSYYALLASYRIIHPQPSSLNTKYIDEWCDYKFKINNGFEGVKDKQGNVWRM